MMPPTDNSAAKASQRGLYQNNVMKTTKEEIDEPPLDSASRASTDGSQVAGTSTPEGISLVGNEEESKAGHSGIVSSIGSSLTGNSHGIDIESQQQEHVDSLSAPSKKERPRKRMMGVLQTLRLLAAFHIVAFHYFYETDYPYWDRFAKWGGVQLTFFFMLSGFVLAYGYGDRPPINDVGPFFFRRWSRLYPTFFLSLVLQLFVVSWDPKAFFTCVFCLNTWVSSQFLNYYNTPGWAVGAFLLQYAIFPVIIRPVVLASQEYRFRVLLPACMVFSFLEATMASGVEVYIYGGLINLLLKPRTSSFIFGVVLGCCFLESEGRTQETEKAKPGREHDSQRADQSIRPSHPLYTLCLKTGFTIVLCSLTALFCFLDIERLPYLLFNWADRGMLLPIYGIIIWLAGQEQDCFLGCILGFSLFTTIGTHASYGVYIFQAAAYNYITLFLLPALEDLGVELNFCAVMPTVLLVFSILVHNFFETPVSYLLNQQFHSFVRRRRKKVREQERRVLEQTPKTTEDLQEEARQAAAQEKMKVGLYYALMLGTYTLFVVWTIWRPNRVTNGIISVDNDSVADFAIGTTKLFAVIAIPALLFNVFGHLVWPPGRRVKVPSLQNQVEQEKPLQAKLYFRIVTRGKNPNLVLQSVEETVETLRKTPLPASQWVVEVATDNHLNFEERTDVPVTELLTPEDYKCERGGKYKARALEYAVQVSSAQREDWVIHMDEESRIDEESVQYIYAHCHKEEKAVRAGKKVYGNIGQGVILYGTAKYPDNYLTTLADSVRVADDFGKFRTQYEIGEPFIGMHGSFVVSQTAVEKDVSFDYGLAGSITEDAHFALMANAIGVKFSWIDAFMYEQSPFTVMDFIRQRARWFGGLLLVVFSKEVPFKQRAILLFMVISWFLSPVVLVAMTLSMLVTTQRTYEGLAIVIFVGATSCWGYLLGFIWTFKLEHGYVRYALLLWAQLALQPIFALMETGGVIHACLFPPIKGFYIVQKEGGNPRNEVLIDEDHASESGISSADTVSNIDGVSLASQYSESTYMRRARHELDDKNRHRHGLPEF